MVRGLIVVLMALGSFVVAPVARSEIVRVNYAGTFAETSHNVGQSGSLDITQRLMWNETEYFNTKTAAAQRTLQAQGGVVSHSGAGSGTNCTLSASGDKSMIPIFVNLGDTSDAVQVTASMPVGTGPGGPLTKTADPNCGTVDYGDPTGAQTTGDDCAGDFSASPAFANPETLASVPSAGFTRKYDGQETLSIKPGTFGCRNITEDTITRTIHATLTVGGGGPSTTPPPAGPSQQRRQKVFAVGDLLTTLLRAEAPCGYVAFGTTAAVWGAAVPGAASAAALIPAQILIAAGEPLCVQYTIRAVQDINIYNDPPAGNIHVIARPAAISRARPRLPSCATRPVTLRSYCSIIRGEVDDLVLAARKTTALTIALRQTVDRETKAKQAGDTKALHAQLDAGDKLVTEIKAADANERRIGARIRKAITSQRVGGRFTELQDAKAIAEILKRLKARHVSRAAIAKLAPAALKAGKYDLLNHLG